MRKVIKRSIKDFKGITIDRQDLINLKGGNNSSSDTIGTIDILDG